MADDEEFRRALGLDGGFTEAVKRWRRGAPPNKNRRAREEAAARRLRKRREDDLVRAQGSEKRMKAATEKLAVVSPWSMPPTKREIMETLKTVKVARNAINTAINRIKKAERGGAWYGAASVKIPGLDEMPAPYERAANPFYDPLPPLMIARDIVEKYAETIEQSLLPRSRARRSKAVVAEDLLRPVLQMDDVSMNEAAAMMRSKGVNKSSAAVTSDAHRLGLAGVQLPKRRRGNKRGNRSDKRK